MTNPPLPQIRLGRSGLTVSTLGCGCWAMGGPDQNLGLDMGWANADDDQSRAALCAAYELGVTHFDTADVYGHGHSERVLGSLVRQVPRDRLVLATKMGYFSGTAPHALDPLHMRHQLEMSLANLGSDYLDILYLHNLDFGPGDERLDDAVDQMHRFREKGLLRAIGMRGPHRHASERARPSCTGGDKRQRFLQTASRIRPDVVQLRFNMLSPFEGSPARVVEWASANDVGVVINKPLAQGLLTGKYRSGAMPSFPAGDHRRRKRWFQPEAVKQLETRLDQIRERFGDIPHDLVSVALSYCLARVGPCSVLTGVRSPSQARCNLSGTVRPLSEDDLMFIEGTFAGLGEQIGTYFARA